MYRNQDSKRRPTRMPWGSTTSREGLPLSQAARERAADLFSQGLSVTQVRREMVINDEETQQPGAV
jgi:hypothetical protein